MTTQKSLQPVKDRTNPLATVLFVFGALSIYNAIEKKKVNIVKSIIFNNKILTSILLPIFIGFGTSKILIDGLKYLTIPLS